MDEIIIDIREDNIRKHSPELLATLLKDHTMSRVKGVDWNIFWATSDYEYLGEGFRYAFLWLNCTKILLWLHIFQIKDVFLHGVLCAETRVIIKS